MAFRANTSSGNGVFVIMAIVVTLVICSVGFLLLQNCPNKGSSNSMELKGEKDVELIKEYSGTKIRIMTKQGIYTYDPETLFTVEIFYNADDITALKIQEK